MEREAKVIHTGGAGGGRRGGFNRSSSRGGGNAAGGGRGSGGWTKRLWGEMSGNEQVDVVRKSDFHLAFFFKKMTASHGVLLKEVEKTFPGQSNRANGKRRRTEGEEHQGVTRLGGGGGGGGEEDGGEGEGEGFEIKPDPEEEEAREQGALGGDGGAVVGVEDDEEDDDDFSMQSGAMGNDDDEDTKPKFRLKVRYNGFQMCVCAGSLPLTSLTLPGAHTSSLPPSHPRSFPKSLTLVLEPSPSARARSPHLFSSQGNAERRQLSATPAMMSAASRARSGTTGIESSSRRATARDSRMPSVAESDAGGGSMRDGSAARGTPLFRGSMTPSDVGDDDVGGGQGATSMSSAAANTTMGPPAMPRRERRAETGEVEGGRQAATPQGDGDDGEGSTDTTGERDGFSLAEQMLLSQDDVSHFVVNERAADDGD